MSTGKRLAKRSIVGTRVCAPGDDGKYYSGYISAVNNPPQPNQELGGLNITPNTRYVVRFDPPPPGCQAPHPLTEFSDRQLIGPGFGSVNDTKLVPGQRVFLTYNGREIQAEVVHHHEDTDDVIMAPTGEGLPSTLNRKLDEVRLLESRKSARLADTDTDFARLADMGSDRKRTVTQSIDVPHSQQMMQTSRKRRTSSSYSSEPRIIEGGEQLDECSAAMVLMSLMTPPGHQVSITQDDVYDERWESGQTDLCGANSSESNSEASWRSATPSPPLSDESGNVSWPSGSNSLNQQQEYYQRQSQAHHQANAAAAASRIIAAAASAHSKYSPNSDYSSSYDGRRNNGKSSYCGGNNANHHGQSSVSSGSPRTDEGWQSDPDHHLPPRKQKRSSVVRSIFREQPIMRMQYSSCGYNMLENRENNNNFINEAMKGEDFYENDVVRDGIRWKCVWRPESLRHQVCGFRGPTWNSVAIHCVKCHLNKDGDPQKLHTKEELDFYVDEEVYDESQEDNMICSGFSPPTKSHFDMARPRAEDPEYQEQIRLLIQNSNPQPSNNTNNLMIANVVSMAPQVLHTEKQRQRLSTIMKPCSAKGSRSIRKAMKQIKPAIGKPLQAYNAPLNIVSVINKVPQSNRRVRGETKKCRKVYGMEHKDLWCTQCKWKKACTRFNDA